MGRDADLIDGLMLAKAPLHVTFTATSATYQMKPHDHCVIVVSGTGADDTGIITLPGKAEASGMFYFISAPTGLAGDDVSVYEKESGSEYAGFDTDDGDLNADDDFLMLYCTGVKWRTIMNGVAA